MLDPTRYFRDDAGRYVGAFAGVEPPAGAIEVPDPPVDARQVWADGAWQPLPPPGYRDRRAPAYVDELGAEKGDAIKTLGDVLDVVIRELRARGESVTPEFAELVDKIDAIKARHPKP